MATMKLDLDGNNNLEGKGSHKRSSCSMVEKEGRDVFSLFEVIKYMDLTYILGLPRAQ